MFLGSWGDNRNRSYVDAETGAVHVAGLESAAPLPTWRFAQFLVDACEQHTRSFDETGRRIGVAPLPEEAEHTVERARPWEAMDPTPWHTEALETVRAALARFAGRPTEVRRVRYELVEPAELEFAQAGYSYTMAGESLLAEGWRRNGSPSASTRISAIPSSWMLRGRSFRYSPARTGKGNGASGGSQLLWATRSPAVGSS